MSFRDDVADALLWAAYRLDPLLGRRDYRALCRRLHEDVQLDDRGLPDWRGPHAQALRAKAKRLSIPMVVSRSSSALLCEHANEMPRGACQCPSDCYCMANSCKREAGERALLKKLEKTEGQRTDWLLKTARGAYPCPVAYKVDESGHYAYTYTFWPNESGKPQVLRLDLKSFLQPPDFRLTGLTVHPDRTVLGLEQGTWKITLVFYLAPLPPEEAGDFWSKLTGEDSI